MAARKDFLAATFLSVCSRALGFLAALGIESHDHHHGHGNERCDTTPTESDDHPGHCDAGSPMLRASP